MSSRVRVETRQKLKKFRVSEIPEFIRHRAADRDAFIHARRDGLWGAVALDYVIETKRAAAFPTDDVVHYVSESAWNEMLVEAERMTKSGSYKNWLPKPLDPPEPKRQTGTSRRGVASRGKAGRGAAWLGKAKAA